MNPLLSLSDFEDALEASTNQPILIFKHSSICPISAGAKDRLIAFLDSEKEDALSCYQVLVRENRDISNAIAERLSTTHQSPQLLLVHNGKVLWHTSHHTITADDIEEALEEHTARD